MPRNATTAVPLLLVALAALAAPPASARETAGNAAPVYWQAIAIFEGPRQDASALDLSRAADPGAPAGDRAKAEQFVSDHQEEIAILLRAAAFEDSDFGIQRDHGPDALIRHIAPMRQGARLLMADARLRLAAGDHAAAAERLAAVFGMARHIAQDRLVISGLVSTSVMLAACQETKLGLESRVFDKADKAVLRRALARLDPEDPCGLRSGLSGEREGFMPWLRAHADPKKREPVRVLLAGMREEPEMEVDRIMALSKREFDRAIDRADDYYAQALEAWEKPDAAEALARLQDSVAAGDFGLLGKAVAPSLTKIRQRHEEILDQLEQLRLWLSQ